MTANGTAFAAGLSLSPARGHSQRPTRFASLRWQQDPSAAG